MFKFLKNFLSKPNVQKNNWFPDIIFLQDDFIIKNFDITTITLYSSVDTIYTNGFIYDGFLYSYIFRNNRYDFDGVYVVDNIESNNPIVVRNWLMILDGVQFSTTNHIVDEDVEYVTGNWDGVFKQNLESLKKLIQEKKMKIILDDDRQTQDNYNYFNKKFPPTPPLRPKSRVVYEKFNPPFIER